MFTFIFREFKAALVWFKGIALELCQFIFRILLRFALAAVVIFFLAGGCEMIRKRIVGQIESQEETTSPKTQAAQTEYRSTSQSSTYRQNDGFQDQIRSGQSQVRSWDYMLRSIKNDFDRWFRKK